MWNINKVNKDRHLKQITQWTRASKILASNIGKMHRFRSSCACTKSYLGLCFLLIHSVVSNESVSGQKRPRSDCADAQSDLGLCCLCML